MMEHGDLPWDLWAPPGSIFRETRVDHPTVPVSSPFLQAEHNPRLHP